MSAPQPRQHSLPELAARLADALAAHDIGAALAARGLTPEGIMAGTLELALEARLDRTIGEELAEIRRCLPPRTQREPDPEPEREYGGGRARAAVEHRQCSGSLKRMLRVGSSRRRR